ncbi:M48 family metallopeptidase [Paremcibacter congregatus]|uniref:Zinc metalloprotease n=1 Tax=Paremcibacter congregatus TaxID=2043170 RepID=A0A2G4YPD8_9PROT|nr:SprT family zinc-dependent metalloprotease [Paremcibacter congregatus]PHZ84157.1 zinc metalloprotease [Paremcibacter congregatus]QDE25783.1 M48 family metallopeptidase [Paremcibacter congregatus]
MTEHYVGDFPLILRRHPRARQLKLRFDAQEGAARITLPPGVSDRKAVQFAHKHHDWIQAQSDSSPKRIRFLPGETIPYQGCNFRILHDRDLPARVTIEGRSLRVGGPGEGFEKRLENWLKKQARLALLAAVEQFTPHVSPKPHTVSVRDTKSRWGSCSSRRTLSFSWRLIMAPPEILSYVVAHEMAHLKEMNHGPNFWKIVAHLDPEWKESRRWLKTEGSRLMLIG